MSWEDFITHVLTTTTKVEKVAVYDAQGRPIAATDDIETTQSEGFALLKCMTDISKTMTRICVDNTQFLCVQGIDDTFIGTSRSKLAPVIVAHLEGEHLVVVIGHAEDRGSFISELKQALQLKAEGRLITQQQLQQSEQLIPVDPSSPMAVAGAYGAVAADQVLVDITG